MTLSVTDNIKNYKGPNLSVVNVSGNAQCVPIGLNLNDYFGVGEDSGGIRVTLTGQQSFPLLSGGITSVLLDTTYRGGPAGGALSMAFQTLDTRQFVECGDNAIVHCPVLTGLNEFILYFYGTPSLNAWGNSAIQKNPVFAIVTNRYMSPIIL